MRQKAPLRALSDDERVSHQEVFDRLATIDPAIRADDYWRGWIEVLAND